MTSLPVFDVTTASFRDDVLERSNTQPVLLDFWAEWCAPCLALAPTMDELAESYSEKLTVAKVNIDSNPNIPAKFGIRGIPTVILFRDGEQVEMFVGASPQKIKEMVERAV